MIKPRIALRSTWLVMLWLAGACADTPESAPAPTPAPESADTAVGNAFLVVEGEGLRVFFGESGSARPLPFSTPTPDLIAALTRVFGAGTHETGDNADCAMRFMKWPRGLTTWHTRNQFTGWSLDRDSDLTTAGGIGIGSTRTELLAVHAAEIQRSSLGQEFTSGGLAGLLDAAGPTARIIHLWAGATCIAR